MHASGVKRNACIKELLVMAVKDKMNDHITHEQLTQFNGGASSDDQTGRKLQTEDALKQAH